MKWPWKRHHSDGDELAKARARFEQNRAAARRATWRLTRAVGAEQEEIRRNHLGEALHAALMAPGRHHP